MSKRGVFITFEGPEGCGKSTQIHQLADYLRSQGRDVIVTREPGGTPVGQAIRDILLDKQNTALCDNTELLLFTADRAQHLFEVIKPALKAGKVVLCDRYSDSTIAYQMGGKGLPEELVMYLTQKFDTSLKPDLTILLDVEVSIGLKRATRFDADRFELEDTEFHQRVRSKYLSIADKEPKRVKIIDTTDHGIDEVQAEIRKIVGICPGLL
ncbi:MAG: dTMP kinase [Candidatus Margulisiibacteriota bacterium]